MILAAGLRLIMLDLKAPHFDEGVNGWFADRLRETGTFAYVADNFHGPWHFYTVFIFQELLGRNLWSIRLPAVLASLLTIPTLFLFSRWFGREAARWAGVAFAVSASGVFYSRYSIHEPWFVLFTVLFSWGVIALWLERSRAGLWASVLGLTGMMLNKETYLLHLGSMALAGGILAGWGKISSLHPPLNRARERTWKPRDAAKAGAVAFFLLLFFYSGNFFHPAGLWGPFEAISAWIQTGAEGQGHEKTAYEILPWINYYWLALLARYEWPALAGLIWSVSYAWPSPAAPRLIAILGGGVLLAYSLVPYKTPWCMASLTWPWFLFFGAAIATSGKWWVRLFGLLLLTTSIGMTIQLNFFQYENDAEPYVYVQTYRELDTLTQPLLRLSEANPQWKETAGAVYLESYYPLPWILGDFPNIGYHGGEIPPETPIADFHVIEAAKADDLRVILGPDFEEYRFRLRSGMEECVVFFSDQLLMAQQNLKNQPKPRRGEP